MADAHLSLFVRQTSRIKGLNDISGSFGKQAEKPRSGDRDALHE
jgi:hypothetical protein